MPGCRSVSTGLVGTDACLWWLLYACILLRIESTFRCCGGFGSTEPENEPNVRCEYGWWRRQNPKTTVKLSARLSLEGIAKLFEAFYYFRDFYFPRNIAKSLKSKDWGTLLSSTDLKNAIACHDVRLKLRLLATPIRSVLAATSTAAGLAVRPSDVLQRQGMKNGGRFDAAAGKLADG